VGYDPAKGGKKPYPLQTTGIDDSYFIPAGGAKPFATDSASAATALFAGIKTDDGNIAWQPGDPPDGAVQTLAELMRAKTGAAIGVVSTVPFSHATPAGLVSHNVSRNNYQAIAAEIINTIRPEVVIGGGYPGQTGTNAYKYIAEAEYLFLKSAAPANPYVFVERADGLDGAETLLAAAESAAAAGKKLFGLFGGPGGNFESPVAHDFPETPLVLRATEENPLLADATLAALKVLSRDPDGFLLMLEQGDIDWANHGNDFKRMVGTMWDLHQAVQAAVDFVNRPDDEINWENTLLIVTSDHGNSYLRLNAVLEAGDLPRQEGACGYSNAACTYPDGEVSYRTTDHTNELVMLYIQGGPAALKIKSYEGSWYPCTRIIDNTQLFHFMAEAAGVAVDSTLSPAIKKGRCGGR
jgi:alkaline phosphatase